LSEKTHIFIITIQRLLFLSIVAFSFPSKAADVAVDAHIRFKSAIAAVTVSDMNFGDILYEASHTGSIELGTNGNVQINGGSIGLSADGGSSTAGEVAISGDAASIVEISCENSGVLASSSGDTLSLQNIELAVNAGQNFGSGIACAGLASSVQTIDFGATPTPTLLFGGSVNVASNAITQNTSFSTMNGGGDPVTVRVVYQ